jgi:hypothetical protein
MDPSSARATVVILSALCGGVCVGETLTTVHSTVEVIWHKPSPRTMLKWYPYLTYTPWLDRLGGAVVNGRARRTLSYQEVERHRLIGVPPRRLGQGMDVPQEGSPMAAMSCPCFMRHSNSPRKWREWVLE